jgi:putative hemin transport protein
MNQSQSKALAIRWKELLVREPGLRIRNAAAKLRVSEVELLSTRCGDTVQRLRPEIKRILQDVGNLGQVMALSRNDKVVHERYGVYRNFSESRGNIGIFVSEDIDLRIFFQYWESVYAVREQSHGMTRHSLQFFAGDGMAIHKIYLSGDSNGEAYKQLVKKYLHPDQEKGQEVVAYPKVAPEIPDSEVKVDSFRKGWLGLKDTHDFAGLLTRYGISRVQALRLAPSGGYAVPVENSTLRRILTEASALEQPIMVFVGNRGIVQIHTGHVHNLLDRDGWFNVLDPKFNLHVKEDAISESWIVTKPGTDGKVTSLECFDSKGNLLVQIFGKRKPGIPERKDWRELIGRVLEENKLLLHE